MQKYVIIQFLEDIEVGVEFPASAWPLHVTVMPRFAVDWDNKGLTEKLSHILETKKPFLATAGKDEHFGPYNNIRVTLLEPNPELMLLHKEIAALLKQEAVVLDEPGHCNEGFKAHATVQRHKRLNAGDHIKIDTLTLVDMYPHNDITRRKALITIRMKGK